MNLATGVLTIDRCLRLTEAAIQLCGPQLKPSHLDLNGAAVNAGEQGALIVSIAALGASLASIFAAILIWMTDRRAKRIEASLRAWTEWSSETKELRKEFRRHLGRSALSAEQGRALATGTEAVGLPAPRSNERDEGRLALVATLNGLERLAIGIDSSLYDLGTIRKLGGTIITSNYKYGEHYIKGRRTASGARRESNAFVHLERLVASLARNPSTEDVNDLV